MKHPRLYKDTKKNAHLKYQISKTKLQIQKKRKIMEKKNNLCERLQKFAVDVILFLRTVKNTVETIDMKHPRLYKDTQGNAHI
ncbi:MAG: hypothetical protein COS14_00110 [Bacteroidetes bacterium CG02_land_8_20_14_3_00_31_25]|nr:MAG: hypothetical protein COS14_00110 [Bacteroidetes bacterium CG02_land_8_20_14_3_00_31_25]